MSLLDEEERAAREEELFPGEDLNVDKVTPAESAVKGEKGEVGALVIVMTVQL